MKTLPTRYCEHCDQSVVKPYHEENAQVWCSRQCMADWMASNLRQIRMDKAEEDRAALRACRLQGVKVISDVAHGGHIWECNGYVAGPFPTHRAALNDATTFLACGVPKQ